MTRSCVATAVAVVFSVSLQTAPGWSQEPPEGTEAVEATEETTADTERIRQLEEELAKVREEQGRLRQAVQEIQKDEQAAPPPAQEPQKSPVKVGASVTVRYDSTELEDQTDLLLEDGEIEGLRTRVRLSVEYSPHQRVAAGVRISTGENPNPTSPFIRLGDAFRSKSFNLDQAYIVVRPLPAFDPLSVTLGKMPLPFWRGDRGSWRSELVWDDDVNPEGAIFQITIPGGSSLLQIENTAGYFIVNEVTDDRFAGLTGDTTLLADQLRLRVNAEAIGATLAAAIYDYNDLNAGLRAPNFTPGSGGFVAPGTSALLVREGLQRTNNRVNFGPGADGFPDDRFTPVNLTAQVHIGLPFTGLAPEVFVLGDYVQNLSVGQDDEGYGITAGLRGGGQGSVGAFNLWYTYRDVDADATLSTFTDSDLGGGTAYKGYEVGANYRFQPDLILQAVYLDFEGFPRKDNGVTRWFVDLVRTF
ncbi:MAG: putative porin [Nitrospirota bacterium]